MFPAGLNLKYNYYTILVRLCSSTDRVLVFETSDASSILAEGTSFNRQVGRRELACLTRVDREFESLQGHNEWE